METTEQNIRGKPKVQLLYVGASSAYLLWLVLQRDHGIDYRVGEELRCIFVCSGGLQRLREQLWVLVGFWRQQSQIDLASKGILLEFESTLVWTQPIFKNIFY